MTTNLKGYLLAVLSVVILSPDAVLIKLMASDSLTILFWRGVAVGVGISLILTMMYGRKTISEYKKIGRLGIYLAFFFSVGTFSFIFAIEHTTVTNTLIILSTSPLMTAVIAHFALREKTKPITWIAMLSVVVGVVTIVSDNIGDVHLIGDLLALNTALALGISFTIMRKCKSFNMVPAMSLSAFITAIIAAIIAPTFFLSAQDTIYVILMSGIVSISLLLLSIAPRFISAAEVGMVMPLETVLGILISWIVIREQPSVLVIVGGLIVLLTLFLYALVPLFERKSKS